MQGPEPKVGLRPVQGPGPKAGLRQVQGPEPRVGLMLVLTSRVLLLVRACIWWRSWARRSCLALRDCSSERPGRAARALESTTCLLPFVGVSASTITITITIMMTMMMVMMMMMIILIVMMIITIVTIRALPSS